MPSAGCQRTWGVRGGAPAFPSAQDLSFLICKVASMLSAGRRVFISERGLNPPRYSELKEEDGGVQEKPLPVRGVITSVCSGDSRPWLRIGTISGRFGKKKIHMGTPNLARIAGSWVSCFF